MWHMSLWLPLAAQSERPPDSLTPLLMMFAMIGLAFWLIILRPQRREQQKRQTALDALKKGDRIVTIGGIHGWVVEVDKGGKTIDARIDTKTVVKLEKSAVSRIENREGAEAGDGGGKD